MEINKIAFKIFEKTYWNHYLELEKQILETKIYVEFNENNSTTFSIKYLFLLQAICSEIDSVGKFIDRR